MGPCYLVQNEVMPLLRELTHGQGPALITMPVGREVVNGIAVGSLSQERRHPSGLGPMDLMLPLLFVRRVKEAVPQPRAPGLKRQGGQIRGGLPETLIDLRVQLLRHNLTPPRHVAALANEGAQASRALPIGKGGPGDHGRDRSQEVILRDGSEELLAQQGRAQFLLPHGACRSDQ